MVTTDPGDVVRAVADGVSRLLAGRLSPAESERQLDALAALYAEQTDVRHPMAPTGDTPLRSRTELREHFAGPGADEDSDLERFEPVRPVVHRTADPEVVIFEFAYAVEAGERRGEVPCVFVVRVQNGCIVESRDYVDHLAMARFRGTLDAVLGAVPR